MMESMEAETRRQGKAVSTESNGSGIEKSKLAMWLDWDGVVGSGIGLEFGV